MLAEKRRKGILAYLDKHERASVLLLAKMFGVTKLAKAMGVTIIMNPAPYSPPLSPWRYWLFARNISPCR
jgi:hypothetical protein